MNMIKAQTVRQLAISVLTVVIVIPASTSRASDTNSVALDRLAVTAIRASTPVNVDGTLDELCWQQASAVTGFTQWKPDQGKPSSEKTVCYFAYDEHNLYFAALCFHSDPRQITANIDNRDAVFGDDWIMLLLNTYNDMRSGYEFVVNPYGIQADLLQFGDRDDPSWDGIWSSRSVMTDSGWQTELAIPLESIRFPNSSMQTWRFQLMRQITQRGEMSTYVPFRVVDNNFLSRTAELRGITGISAGQRATVLPYLTVKSDKGDGSRRQVEFGGDLKYALNTSLVADLTANPDFGQVEADIDQINLGPYELYLQEKRPFFLERMDIFDTPEDLFYSRRISKPLVGLKVSGKLGKYGIGGLYALNDNQGLSEKEHFGVVRLERDILAQSRIGFIGTAKETDGRHNRVAAVDWRIIHKSILFEGQAAKSFSNTNGRLTWIGNSSVNFGRNNWNLLYSYRFQESRFEAASGFVTPMYSGLDMEPVSYREHLGSVSYTWQVNNGWLRRVTPYGRYSLAELYLGSPLDRGGYVRLTTEFSGNVTAEFGTRRNQTLWEKTSHDTYDYYVSVSANPTKYFTSSAQVAEGQALDYWNAQTVWQREESLSLSLRPSPRVEVSPSINHVCQYVERGGTRTLSQWIGVLQGAYNSSSDLFIRAFLQWNSESDYFTANLLLGYTFLPGSTFYLAYNSGYDNGEQTFAKDSEIVFGKISYLLSL